MEILFGKTLKKLSISTQHMKRILIPIRYQYFHIVHALLVDIIILWNIETTFLFRNLWLILPLVAPQLIFLLLHYSINYNGLFIEGDKLIIYNKLRFWKSKKTLDITSITACYIRSPRKTLGHIQLVVLMGKVVVKKSLLNVKQNERKKLNQILKENSPPGQLIHNP